MYKFELKKLFIIGLIATAFIGCGIVQAEQVAAQNQKYNSSQQYQAANEDMELYVIHTRRAIKNNWYPSTSSFEHTATLGLLIDPEGKLINCQILQSSSDNDFDNSLIEAAKKTVYSPLPKSYRGDKANIVLDFGMHRHTISK